MRDVEETEVRERLHALAGAVQVPPSLERPTIRRARRRRAVNAATSALIVIGLIAGSYAGLRALNHAETTFVNDPTPTPAPEIFAGLWPETDAEALAEMQRQVDDGHHPLRVDPAGTATELATNLLNWRPEDVRVDGTAVTLDGDDARIVTLSNDAFAQTVPRLEVEVRQLGETGPNGVWSVAGVSTPLIELDPVQFGTASSLTVSGRLTDLFEGGASVAVNVLDGATFDTTISQARVTVGDELRFEARLTLPPTLDGRAIVVVWVPDAVGMSLGTVAFPVQTATGTPPSSSAVDVGGVPPVVAATAQRIHEASIARDFDTLAGLMDPNIFIYNLDDGSDPIPAWREDPSILDTIAAVLELPPVAIDIEGMGRFYIWPYLAQADLADPTPEQLRDLERLGVSLEDVQAFGSYLGPRLAIDASGLWRNFVVGGD